MEREFKRHLHYNRQISIPHPEFHQEQKLDQFVNPQQQLYPQYQTMNTANLAIHPYHQNTMQYIQPTLYSVSVPQSADFYWNKESQKWMSKIRNSFSSRIDILCSYLIMFTIHYLVHCYHNGDECHQVKPLLKMQIFPLSWDDLPIPSLDLCLKACKSYPEKCENH